jgi:hypothetical protein
MNLFCHLFGHKPQEGVYSGAEYMRWGSWGTVDGIGRDHRSLEAKCARCEKRYTAGKIHMPTDMVLAKEQRDQAIQHLHALLDINQNARGIWEAENAGRDWLESIGSESR